MTIIYLGLAWLLGIWLASAADLPIFAWIGGALVSLLAFFVFHKQPQSRLWFGCIAILCLGAARYSAATPSLAPTEDPTNIAFYNGNEDAVIVGLVVAEPEYSDRLVRLRVSADSITLLEQGRRPVEGEILITVPRFPTILYGTRLQITGRLEAPANDPEFSYRDYLARQGIHSQMFMPEASILEIGAGVPILQTIFAIKDRARLTIQKLLPDPQAALLTGILLGDDSRLAPELEEQFRATGLTHIIAISGFNIAILVGLLVVVSKPILGRRRAAWFVLVGLGVYVVLVGAGASVVRAAIMGSLFVIAFYLMGRPTFAPALLFVAAIAMTLIDPFILWDVGFQLSFAATLGLMLYLGPWSKWTEIRLTGVAGTEGASKATRILADIALATLAAILLTLPLIAYYFGQISLISPLANLLVLPAQPGVMTWGGLAALTGLVSPAVGQLFAWVAWIFLTWTIGLVRVFASVPLASVPVRVTPLAVISTYVIILGVTWLVRMSPEKRSNRLTVWSRNLTLKIASVVSAVLALLAIAWAGSQPDGDLHVSFLDVGQGDATFIQTPSGRQILVDGGAYPTVLSDHLGREMPFWDRDIDILIATHADTDHLAGLPAVFDRYQVGRLVTNGLPAEEQAYKALMTAADERGTPVHHALAGETIVIDDGVRLEILNPAADGLSQATDRSDNDNSVALRLIYDDFSLLFTGDASQAVEEEMLNSGYVLSAIVYKAGHHGARDSSSSAFLEAVRPQYVVVSAGEGNRFDHPHPEMLERAGSVGAAVLRTDELGTIQVISDGQRMWLQAD